MLSYGHATHISQRKQVIKALLCVFAFSHCHGLDGKERRSFLINISILNFRYRYIAVMPGWLPRRNKLFHFNGGDVEENFKAISIFRGLTYKVNGRAMLISPERFRKSADLYDMLNATDSKKYQLDTKKK